MVRQIWVACLFVFVACTPTPVEQNIPHPSPTSQLVMLQGDGMIVAFRSPDAWYTFPSEHRITLTEKPRPITESGLLDGITVTISLPEFDDRTAPLEANLQKIIHNRLANNMSTSDPQSFATDEYEVGYYIVDHGEGGTLVLLMQPLNDRPSGLIAISLSTSSDELNRARDLLPQILTGLEINGQIVNADLHERLPQVINVPIPRSEAAMEASSEP